MFLGWDIGLSSVSRLVSKVDQLFSPNCVHNAQFVNVTCEVVMTYENSGKFAFSASPRKKILRVVHAISIYQHICYIYQCIVYLAQNCDPNCKRNRA